MLREIKAYYIDKIIKDTGYGATKPIVVSANNKEYVLKVKYDGFNPTSLAIFNELLAYQLISYLNYKIAPQEVVYLVIDDNFLEMAQVAFSEGVIDNEAFENIKNSKGINIGIEYIHTAIEPLNGTIENKSFLKELLHIDNYILNCDRTQGNINILQDAKQAKKYYAIDFGSALADGNFYLDLKENNQDMLMLSRYKDCNTTLAKAYVFKEDCKKLIKRGKRIKQDIATIRKILEEIINDFPKEWEVLHYKDDIIDLIASRLKSKDIFKSNSKCNCLV